MAIALFRLMGALGRDFNRTNVYGSFVLVLVILLGGFALTKGMLLEYWTVEDVVCYGASLVCFAAVLCCKSSLVAKSQALATPKRHDVPS